MKLVSFRRHDDPAGAARCGALLDGGEVLDFSSEVAGIAAPASYLHWFDRAGPTLPRALAAHARAAGDAAHRDWLRAQGGICARAGVTLLAPVPRPGKVICIGLNYHDHAKESGMAVPDSPVVFSKFPTSVIGPGAAIELPAHSDQVDYEAELGVVIGRRARGVRVQDAAGYVLGYTNVHDVSARDFQFADGQWQRGKSCDTFCPLGEYVAVDEIDDPHALGIRLRRNGETLQDSNTDQLIFGVFELVAFLAEHVTLEPGDVIATGTPPGVGFARKPPVFLRDGDTVEVEIDGLGVLRNPVRAAASPQK